MAAVRLPTFTKGREVSVGRGVAGAVAVFIIIRVLANLASTRGHVALAAGLV